MQTGATAANRIVENAMAARTAKPVVIVSNRVGRLDLAVGEEYIFYFIWWRPEKLVFKNIILETLHKTYIIT